MYRRASRAIDTSVILMRLDNRVLLRSTGNRYRASLQPCLEPTTTSVIRHQLQVPVRYKPYYHTYITTRTSGAVGKVTVVVRDDRLVWRSDSTGRTRNVPPQARGPMLDTLALCNAFWMHCSTCHATMPTTHFGAKIVSGSEFSSDAENCCDRASGLPFLEPGL